MFLAFWRTHIGHFLMCTIWFYEGVHLIICFHFNFVMLWPGNKGLIEKNEKWLKEQKTYCCHPLVVKKHYFYNSHNQWCNVHPCANFHENRWEKKYFLVWKAEQVGERWQFSNLFSISGQKVIFSLIFINWHMDIQYTLHHWLWEL